MELIPEIDYLIPTYGAAPALTFKRMYNGMAIFSSKEEVSYYWCNTLNGKRGGHFDKEWYLILPIPSKIIINDPIYNWAMRKIDAILNNKASTKSVEVTIKIAESLMFTRKYEENALISISKLINENARILILEKQKDWNEVILSLENTLPF